MEVPLHEGSTVDSVSVAGSCCSSDKKLSHKKWRASLKKKKRQARRQALAQQVQCVAGPADQEESPEENEAEEAVRNDRGEIQRQNDHAMWLLREDQAQQQWKARKEAEAKEKKRIEEEQERIRKEWEEQQKKEEEEKAEQERKEAEKKEKQDALLEKAIAGTNKGEGPWHNPLAPVSIGKERVIEDCPFFKRTGACRFGERCSRGHPRPDVSRTILIPNMYAHFGLDQAFSDDYDTDLSLEFEEGEAYQHFREFYIDVLPEFKKIGRVVQFKVCCNCEPHLRGNVYVQYDKEADAEAAFMRFNGRWYGGRQLSCEFTSISRWRMAICGLYHQKKCPKGKTCNFLHVFNNPGNEFHDADMDRFDMMHNNRYRGSHSGFRSSSRYSRYNQYSERRGDSRRESRHRDDRSRSDRRSRDHRKSRSQRPLSRSRSRSRSRSPRRRRSRSRSKSPSHRSQSRSHQSRSKSRSRSGSRTSSPRRKTFRSRSKSRSPRRERLHLRSRSRSPSYASRSQSHRFRSKSKSPSHKAQSWSHKSRSKSPFRRSRSPSHRSNAKSTSPSHRSPSGSPSHGSQAKTPPHRSEALSGYNTNPEPRSASQNRSHSRSRSVSQPRFISHSASPTVSDADRVSREGVSPKRNGHQGLEKNTSKERSPSKSDSVFTIHPAVEPSLSEVHPVKQAESVMKNNSQSKWNSENLDSLPYDDQKGSPPKSRSVSPVEKDRHHKHKKKKKKKHKSKSKTKESSSKSPELLS